MPPFFEVEGRFKRAKLGDLLASFCDTHLSILVQMRLAGLVPGHEDEVGHKLRRRYQAVYLRGCEPQNRTVHAHGSTSLMLCKSITVRPTHTPSALGANR